ncbi:hypothetical protein D4Q80_02520, partial [bacterium]
MGWYDEKNNICYYQKDLPMIKELNANTVRVYEPIEDVEVLDEIAARGLKVIIGFGEKEIKDGSYVAYIQKYYNHPAILLWCFGNEERFHTERWEAVGLNWNSELQKAARRVHEIEDELIKQGKLRERHPVSTAYGDMPTKETIEACSEVDVWGLNLYRFDYPIDALLCWNSMTDKPMYLSEFGADSYNENIADAALAREQGQLDQKKALRRIWKRLTQYKQYQQICSGGVAFEFSDEWWKSEGQGTSPDVQDIGGNSGVLEDVAYDGVRDEEDFGLTDIDRNPKPGYYELQKLYGQLLSEEEMPSEVLFNTATYFEDTEVSEWTDWNPRREEKDFTNLSVLRSNVPLYTVDAIGKELANRLLQYCAQNDSPDSGAMTDIIEDVLAGRKIEESQFSVLVDRFMEQKAKLDAGEITREELIKDIEMRTLALVGKGLALIQGEANILKIYPQVTFGYIDENLPTEEQFTTVRNSNHLQRPAVKIDIIDFSDADADFNRVFYYYHIRDARGELLERIHPIRIAPETIKGILEKLQVPASPAPQANSLNTQNQSSAVADVEPPTAQGGLPSIFALLLFAATPSAKSEPKQVPAISPDNLGQLIKALQDSLPNPQKVKKDKAIVSPTGVITGMRTYAIDYSKPAGQRISNAYRTVEISEITELINHEYQTRSIQGEIIPMISEFAKKQGFMDIYERLTHASAFYVETLSGEKPNPFKTWYTIYDNHTGQELVQINPGLNRIRFVLYSLDKEEVGSIDYAYENGEIRYVEENGEMKPEILGIGVLLDVKGSPDKRFAYKYILIKNTKTNAYFIEVRNKTEYGILEELFTGDYAGDVPIEIATLQDLTRRISGGRRTKGSLIAKIDNGFIRETHQVLHYYDMITSDGRRSPRDYLRLVEIPATTISYYTKPDGEHVINPATGKDWVISSSNTYALEALPQTEGEELSPYDFRILSVKSYTFDYHGQTVNFDLLETMDAQGRPIKKAYGVLLHKAEARQLSEQIIALWENKKVLKPEDINPLIENNPYITNKEAAKVAVENICYFSETEDLTDDTKKLLIEANIAQIVTKYDLRPGDAQAYIFYNGTYGRYGVGDYSLVTLKTAEGEYVLGFSETANLNSENGNIDVDVINMVDAALKELNVNESADTYNQLRPLVHDNFASRLLQVGFLRKSYSEIKDKKGKLYAILDGAETIGGTPSWISFPVYGHNKTGLQLPFAEIGPIHVGIATESFTYPYAGSKDSKYYRGKEAVAHMHGLIFEKNKTSQAREEYLLIYNTDDTRSNRKSVKQIGLRLDGRTFYEINRMPWYQPLTGRLLEMQLYADTKLYYDESGLPLKTMLLFTGSSREKLLYEHTVAFVKGNPTAMWVYNRLARASWLRNAEYGLDEFVDGREARATGVLALSAEEAESLGQRDASFLKNGEKVFEKRNRFNPEVYLAYKEQGLKGIAEFVKIHLTVHLKNNWIYNLYLEPGKRGTILPTITVIIVGLVVLTFILGPLINLVTRILSGHFRKTGSRYNKSASASPVGPKTYPPIDPAVRKRIYDIIPHLTFIEPFVQYLAQLDAEDLEVLKERFYGAKGTAQRDAIDQLPKQTKEDLILKPIAYFFLLILNNQYALYNQYSIGQIKKAENGGFIFKDDYFQDFIEFCLKDKIDPIVDPQFGFSRFLPGTSQALEELMKTNAAGVNDAIKTEIIPRIKGHLEKKYKQEGISIPEFPIKRGAFLTVLWVLLNIGFVISAIASFVPSVGWLFTLLAYALLSYEAWVIGPYLKFHFWYLPKGLITIGSSSENYKGDKNNPEIKEKVHFWRVYFWWWFITNFLMLVFCVAGSIGKMNPLGWPFAFLIYILGVRELARSGWYLLVEAVALARQRKERWYAITSYNAIDKDRLDIVASDAFLRDAYEEILIKGTLLEYHFVTEEEAGILYGALKSGELPNLRNWRAKKIIVEFFNKIEMYRRLGLSLDEVDLSNLPRLFILFSALSETMLPSPGWLDRPKDNDTGKDIPVIKSPFRLIKERFDEDWRIYLADLLRVLPDSDIINKLAKPGLSFADTVNEISIILREKPDDVSNRIIRKWISYHTVNPYKTLKSVYHSAFLSYRVFLKHKLHKQRVEDVPDAEVEEHLRFILTYQYPSKDAETSKVTKDEFLDKGWELNKGEKVDKPSPRTIISLRKTQLPYEKAVHRKVRNQAFAFRLMDDGSEDPGVVFLMDWEHLIFPSDFFLLPLDLYYKEGLNKGTGLVLNELVVSDEGITPTNADQTVAENNWNNRMLPAEAVIGAHSLYGVGRVRINALRGSGFIMSTIEDTVMGDEVLKKGFRYDYSPLVTIRRGREKVHGFMKNFVNRFGGPVTDEFLSVRYQRLLKSDLLHWTEKMSLLMNFDFYFNKPFIVRYNFIIFLFAFFISFTPYAYLSLPLFFVGLQYLLAQAITAGGVRTFTGRQGALRGYWLYLKRFWSL